MPNRSLYEGFSLRDLPPVPKKKSARVPRPVDWKAIAKSRAEAHKKQIEGFESSEIFKLTIEAKLATFQLSGEPWWTNFQRCGREKNFIGCALCAAIKEVAYQCNQKICPRCNWRIADNRRKLLAKMTAGIFGCKHVVITQKNFDSNLREKIRESRANLLKLRRQKIMGKVRGGCASLEITNESCGWHPHWHMLLESPFIDAKKLAVEWGRLVGQEFAIVKVKDVTEKSYLAELCKYAASGAELASWTPSQILEFCRAVRGIRMFTVFGSFKEIRSMAAMQVASEKPPQEPCRCGCDEKIFGSSPEMVRRIITKQQERERQ